MTEKMRKAANAYKTAKQNKIASKALFILKNKRPIKEVTRNILDTMNRTDMFTQ